jgi:hypothetical protein
MFMASALRSIARQYYWTFFLIFVFGFLAGRFWDDLSTPALAQIPDSGRQRMELIQELQAANQKLSELTKLIQTQTFKVRVIEPDKKTDGKKRTRMSHPGPDRPAEGFPRTRP